METFMIRAYRDGDEFELNRLFNEIFGASRSLDEWHWKFTDNPAHTTMIEVAESGGKIVGQYSDMPAFYQYLNDVVLFSLPVDNFILPRFRGGIKGVQKALFEFRRQYVMRLGIPVSLGFPNDAAYVVGKRILKYKDLAKMPVLFMRLNFRLAVRNRAPRMPSFLLGIIQVVSSIGFTIALKVGKSQPESAVRTRIVDSFDARVDVLWNRAKQKHRIMCVRDSRFLGWRYSKPGAAYRIVIAERGKELLGYAVTRVMDEAGVIVGRIVDLFTDESPGADAALVRHSLFDLLSSKADYAVCWMLPDKGAFRVLREIGFAQKESAFPSVNTVFDIYAPQIDEEVAADSGNWFLTMGDSDVY